MALRPGGGSQEPVSRTAKRRAEHQSDDRVGNGEQSSDAGYRVSRADRSMAMARSGHGSVLIAAITSCTNTSNPSRDARGGFARQESG